MHVMVCDVSTAGAQQDLHRRIADLQRELREAHQREAATAELLGVINRPRFALQSVFDTIAQSAMRLCEGEFAFASRFEGRLVRFAASYGLIPEGLAALRNSLPTPAGNDTANGRAVLHRAVVRLRESDPIGGITVGRARVGPSSEAQIRLLQTFVDQALIAIENTRPFETEQACKHELQESLEYQTAIGEVLGAISRTPTELQPVPEEICKTANRLCDTPDAEISLRHGKWLRVGSVRGSTGAGATDKIALTRGYGWASAKGLGDLALLQYRRDTAVADATQ